MKKACFSCDNGRVMTRFENEAFAVDYADVTVTVDGLSGWRCQDCGEVEFDAASAERYAAAGDELVLAERTRISKEIRRIRKRLGLSQEDAARLTGGGHNAFSRYESGKVEPLPAVVNLLRLLDKHPELLAELQPDGTTQKRAAS